MYMNAGAIGARIWNQTTGAGVTGSYEAPDMGARNWARVH